MNNNFQSKNGNGYRQDNTNASTKGVPLNPCPKIRFYDEKKNIQTDLFDGVAQKIANSFYGDNKTGISITQLRRLFDEVKRFRQIIETANDSDSVWEAQLPYIKMIRSKLTYTIARMVKKNNGTENYYKELSSFISQCIDLIQIKEDYFVFCSLFEAVYGFYYEHAPKEYL